MGRQPRQTTTTGTDRVRKELRGLRLVDERPRRRKNARDLVERSLRSGDVVERAEVDDHIESFIGERHPTDITAVQLRLGPMLPEVVGSLRQQLLIDIETS